METICSWKLFYSIGIFLCGLFFIIAPPLRKLRVNLWAKKAIYVAGIFFILYALLLSVEIGLFDSFMSDDVILFLKNWRSFFGGAGAGIVITLFIAGEFNKNNTEQSGGV